MILLKILSLFVCVVYISAENANCPAYLPKNDHLIQFQSNCYEFILDHPGDWYHAEADCKTRGGHLTDIYTYAEQAFVFNSVQGLSITDNINDKGIWIGLTDYDGEGNWHWANGKPLTFTNWASGQPGMVSSLEDCGLMTMADSGHWHDFPCHGFFFSTESHGWVCKHPIV